ncbi:MAG TPA: Ni/Fe hydrogenase subunit alpha, partial [Syntrophobacteraceae bacterium]|nr:Ni/Fe hydrogenase subunit alpha [Syntrophobacteraceae bacterium]
MGKVLELAKADQILGHAEGGKVINIQPVTRIEGHGRISIHLDDDGNVTDARLYIMSVRGFEKFIEGRPAEEVPRIVTRICGICPWMHHTASNKAVDGCFGATVPPAGKKLRELMQIMAYINDKVLHFFFLAAPDFVMGADADYAVRNVLGIVQAAPELAKEVVKIRYRGQMMIEKFAGKVIHPIAMVTGGFSKPMLESERQELLEGCREQLEFAKFAMDFAKKSVFYKLDDAAIGLGEITTGFLGTVRPEDGSLNIHDGVLRLMKADGAYQDYTYQEYVDVLGEHIEPWSYGKMPYARAWGEGFSMDLEAPKGIYRANTLARVNVCDGIATPLAQAELEEFRSRFGRPAQSTMLFHWARMIE